MFFTMIISLYSSRLTLELLGVTDFGIFNIVSGFVFMLTFLNSSMSNTTQRFFAFELGKVKNKSFIEVFRVSYTIHFFIAILILIIAETIGLWFVNNKLNIPFDRLYVTNIVYQLTVMTAIVNIMLVPYNAVIINNEKMNFYAFITTFEVVLRLLCLIVLGYLKIDKLILFSTMILLITIIIRIIYVLYCRNKFKDCKYGFVYDLKKYKEIIQYSGWSLFGSVATIGSLQGVNILLNLFFGTTINAARGIAFQVQGAVNQFVVNFQTAINPQIVKSYASNDFEYMKVLIFQGSKFSFIVLYLVSLPVIIEVDFLINLWLKNIPSYTTLFCKLILINSLVVSISGPLSIAAQATGKIRKYQIVMGLLLLLNLPFSYLLLKRNFPPQITIYVSVLIEIIALIIRLQLLKSMICISITQFYKSVLLKLIYIIIPSLTLTLITKQIINSEIVSFISVTLVSTLSILFFSYFLGISMNERLYINQRIEKLLRRI